MPFIRRIANATDICGENYSERVNMKLLFDIKSHDDDGGFRWKTFSMSMWAGDQMTISDKDGKCIIIQAFFESNNLITKIYYKIRHFFLRNKIETIEAKDI